MQHGNAVPLVIEKLKERASDLVKALNLIVLWTSKLRPLNDIQHSKPEVLEGLN